MKNKSKCGWIVALFLCTLAWEVQGQSGTHTSFGEGIRYLAQDSSFYTKFSVRFQTLYTGVWEENSRTLVDAQYDDALLIRRFRLKFDGWAFSPKVVYKFELGQSNRDTGGQERANFNYTAKIILDAVIKWNFYHNLTVWFGQTKLPGNRERVISSQKLQTVDRSLVNSRFNIDRDLGIQLRNKNQLGNTIIREIFSISMGEGRDVITNNLGGYDYTGRLEFLPLGEFADRGDYFGADLEREHSPKLAVGVTFDYNDRAARQGGQLGAFVEDSLGNQITNSLSGLFIDAIFKYHGFSVQTEYANKSAGEDVLGYDEDGEVKYQTGSGFVVQSGYLLKRNYEFVARYTTTKPDNTDFSSITRETEYTIGLSKYVVGHNLKIQTDFSYRERLTQRDFYMFRFQAELSL